MAIQTCPKCGAKNRVDERAGECGHAAHALHEIEQRDIEQLNRSGQR